MSVLTELADLEQQHLDRYRELVRSVADGKEVVPGEALSILQAANKSRDELQREVAHLLAVAKLEKAVADGEAADAKLAGLNQQIQQLIAERQAAFDEASRVCAEKAGPVEAEKAECLRLSMDADRARGELSRMKPRQPQQTFEQRRAEQQELLAKQVADKPIVHRDPTGWNQVQ